MVEFECAVCKKTFVCEADLPEFSKDVVIVCDECNKRLTDIFGKIEEVKE